MIMNTLVYALFGLVLIAVLVVTVGLPFAMWRNRRTAERYRERLIADMKETRLHRMLGALGLQPARHLHQIPIVEVTREMRNCAACDATAACDRALNESPDVSVDDISYCPNQQSLRRAVEGRSDA